MNEFKYIINKISNDMCFKASNKDLIDIASKFFYFFYWFFDNLFILSKIKLIQNFDQSNLNKLAMLNWFLGNVTSILKMMMDLDELYKQKLYSDKSSKEANLKLDKAIFNTYLNIIGKIGDCFPSSQGCNIPQRFIGRPWSETTVGIGGLISALVALKNTWK